MKNTYRRTEKVISTSNSYGSDSFNMELNYQQQAIPYRSFKNLGLFICSLKHILDLNDEIIR